jgi:hypothetical protein
MKTKIAFLLFLFSFCKLQAQITNLVGVVINNKNGERIPYANILVLERSIGVSANSNGYFELSVPSANIIVRASAVGFEPKDVSLELLKTDKKSILIKLDEAIISTPEVTIEVERYREELSLTRYNIQSKQIKEIPFVAEPDPIRAMQTLPGVTLNSDFNNKLFVRGGNFDETSITLDGVPLYNVNHLGSLVGSFNDDIFKNVKLYPSNYPVKYGGYLSGILEMETLDGKTDYTRVVAGLSVISSKIFAEGSIGDATYVLSGRRTYYDVATKIYKMIEGKEITIPTYFYDLFGKVSYPVSKDFIIKAESFFSHDYYNFSYRMREDIYRKEKNTNPFWNTFMLNISGFYNMSDISSFKLGGYLSQAILKIDMKDILQDNSLSNFFQDTNIVYADNRIKDITLYVENDLKIQKHSIKSGIEYKQINLGYNWFGDSQGLNDFAGDLLKPPDLLFDYAPSIFDSSNNTSILSIYASDFFELMPRLFSNIGFRFSYLSDLSLSHLTPFVNLKYYFTSNLSLNLGYASYYQYLYSIRDNLNKTDYAFSPMSVLFLVKDKENIPASNHFSFGVEIFNLFSDCILNAEAYLKDYSNLVSSYNVEPIYRYEDGKSYGVDILFRKTTGFITGWLAYTLSKSFKDNEGTKYYSSYDRTHNLKIIGDFNISSVFKIGFQYNYATGLVYTPITSSIFILGGDDWMYFPYGFFISDQTDLRVNYGLKNSQRAPNYSRLDISMTGAFAWNNFVLKPYISVINVLNSQNFFFVNYIPEFYGTRIEEDRQNSSLIIPTIGITAEYQF